MGRIAVLFAFALLGAGAAGAGDAPVIVIPGKAGVPVIINGFDASFAVVEGDWGLERPGQVPATIVTGPLIVPEPGYSRSYFPAFGRRPGYGRREVEPPANRRLPPPAERYERFWGAESAPLPATVEPSAERAQINVEANGDQRNGRRWHAQRRSPEKGKHPPSRAHAH
jgi:hypothetical protein